MLFWTGALAAVPGFMMIVPPLVMGLLYYRAASQEELSIRQSSLGTAYAEYERSAGMFMPRIMFWRARQTP